MAAASMFAQTQTTTSTTSTSYIQTSKLIGTKVKASRGEEIGVIKDVVLDRNTGCMAYTVLSAGGTGTRVIGQAKTVAVPWAVYTPSTDVSVLTVRVDRDRIYNAPIFDYARINEYETTEYITNVYSYYGVSPQAGFGISGGASGTTTTDAATTTTGTATTTGAASPTATASTGATASPMATASPGAAYSPAGTASPRATASPGAAGSEKKTRGRAGKTKAEVTPSPTRGQTETASPGQTEESTPESAVSPSEGKKSSRRHGTKGSSTPETTATPETEQE
jgi:sporulation protein YlmC with PRC-barrel domain